MNGTEQHQRQELDRDIMSYVREAVRMAPVTAEAVHGFIRVARRKNFSVPEIDDRLRYLESAGYLEKHTEWTGGEFVHYTITADGMDVLDGVRPPRGWTGK